VCRSPKLARDGFGLRTGFVAMLENELLQVVNTFCVIVDSGTTIQVRFVFVMTRDVKKICTHRYPRIKPATSRKQILKMDTHYLQVRVFFIPAC